jgi:hypothetical protein
MSPMLRLAFINFSKIILLYKWAITYSFVKIVAKSLLPTE